MRRCILCIFIAACGPAILVESADKRSAVFVDMLIHDSDDRHLNVLGYGRPGAHVLADAEWISDYNDRNGRCAAGVHQGNVIVLAPTDEWVTCVDANGGHDTLRVSAVGAKLVLAHELGHVAGVTQHTEHGLMAPYDTSCVGREVECLDEVLR